MKNLAKSTSQAKIIHFNGGIATFLGLVILLAASTALQHATAQNAEFSAPDLKIESVNQKKKNIEVRISNPGKLPLPVALKFEFENGEILEDYKSAYIWKGNPETVSLNYKSAGKIKQVSLDDNDIDVYREDNVWSDGE
jgi:hypothetical protein